MKKTALALLIALSSSAAFAQTQSYVAHAIGKQPSACPVAIMRVEVTTKPSSIESQSTRILMTTGAALLGETKGHDRSCQSDIICEGYDVVDMPVDGNPDLLIDADSVEALLTHNNDGKYPTTNKPGFKEMQLLMMSSSGTMQSACYYDLIPAL